MLAGKRFVFAAPGDRWSDFLPLSLFPVLFRSHDIMILIGSTVNISDNFLVVVAFFSTRFENFILKCSLTIADKRERQRRRVG